MRIAIDTNVLAYSEGVNGDDRRVAAADLLGRLRSGDVRLPVQVLGELHRVLVRKGGKTRDEAKAIVLEWGDLHALIATTPAILASALDLANDHQIDIWDAIIMAAAAADGCRLLLSEDLQDGFTWAGVTVVNPFAATPDPLLTAALRPH